MLNTNVKVFNHILYNIMFKLYIYKYIIYEFIGPALGRAVDMPKKFQVRPTHGRRKNKILVHSPTVLGSDRPKIRWLVKYAELGWVSRLWTIWWGLIRICPIWTVSKYFEISNTFSIPKVLQILKKEIHDFFVSFNELYYDTPTPQNNI